MEKGGKSHSLLLPLSVFTICQWRAPPTPPSLRATPQRWLTSERERCHPDKKTLSTWFCFLLCLLFPSASCSRDFREKGWIGSGNERRKRGGEKTSSTFNDHRRAPQFSSSSSNSFRFCNKFAERKKTERRGSASSATRYPCSFAANCPRFSSPPRAFFVLFLPRKKKTWANRPTEPNERWKRGSGREVIAAAQKA